MANAFRFVPIAAEARFEGNVRELFDVVGEPTLLICLPEKLGVREARAQDLFMPLTYEARAVLVEIYDRKEMRLKFPTAVLDGKVFLMIAHHGNRDFGR